ncbi:MAG: rRNA pseudouridine synthase [Deltaproteobacteria bacterium]|nr:rRNA pseudouridine synthase [Candidatus Zymogenaceae bacterium]
MKTLRLNKFISRSGLTSVRGAEELISQGRVLINGEVATEPGMIIDPAADVVHVDGEQVLALKKKHYYRFYKPKGVVSTMSDPEGRPSIDEYTSDLSVRVFPAGRLDYDADGLMILTNDGDTANALMHPSSKLPKTYQVKISGSLTPREIERFAGGVTIDRKKTLPAKIRLLEKRPGNSWYEVTIREGRNRQIKKMFSVFNKRVLKLRRVSIGPIQLEGLAPGEIQKFTSEERKRFLEFISSAPTKRS